VAERALAHYREAETVMARAPRKTVRAPRVMGKVYRSILEGMMAQGWAAPRPRVRPSRLKLLGILLRYAIV
jgi:phytoene synthase